MNSAFVLIWKKDALDNAISGRVPPMCILEGPGVGKSTVIGYISKVANLIQTNSTVRLGTAGMVAFDICRLTSPYKALQGS